MRDIGKVSIIVPLYRGEQYLSHILSQVEQCARNAGQMTVEMILYNDFPEEEIWAEKSGYSYDIKIFNSEKNLGIHGARVQGLMRATGSYVLFLDQDDRITPDYLRKQAESIGDADAVVCRAIHNRRLHYTSTHAFEKVISKDFMLKKWCPIVSPGQVLIRKASIPEMWQRNILKHNGADDYFLWLLMAGEGKRFSLNQEVLFEHVVTGINTSDDTNEMMDSECEMIEILKSSHVFQGEDEKWLDKLPESLRKIHIKELDNYKKAFFLFQNWTQKVSAGASPVAFFEEKGLKKIAVYGAGDVGRSLELLLRNTGIEVSFFIDQNAGYILSELPVYRKEEAPGGIDAIVMTVKDNALVKELERVMKCPVYDVGGIWL